MGIQEKIQDIWIEFAARRAVGVLRKWEESAFIKVVNIIEKFVQDEDQKQTIVLYRQLYENRHPFLEWWKRFATQLNPYVQEKFFANVVLRSLFANRNRRNKFLAEHGFYPPTNLVIDVTARCNLRCKGCWAAKYTGDPDMDLSLLRKILNEAQSMGINFITITGGEPFMRKDMFQIYEQYPGVFFHVYTNGYLIDKDTAEKLARLGNVAPMLSIEGLEENTDARRGKGTFRKLMEAMDNLREAGVFFGFSVTTTRDNIEEVTGDEFIDLMIQKGCMNGWYFNFVPVGIDPDPEVMPTPQQRAYSRKRTYTIRNSKPIFVADFWNDAPAIKGCMAGGKWYLHITVNGDVEPCVFVHFAVDNIKEKTLLEVLKSPFFEDIRNAIPYDGNYLRPCMIIDRPWILREHIKKHNARPTHEGAEAIITQLAPAMDRYAHGVAELYDRAWQEGDWIRLYSLEYMNINQSQEKVKIGGR